MEFSTLGQHQTEPYESERWHVPVLTFPAHSSRFFLQWLIKKRLVVQKFVPRQIMHPLRI